MTIRTRTARLLRQVDIEPLSERIRDRLFGLEVAAFRLANRLDPLPWGDEGEVDDGEWWRGLDPALRLANRLAPLPWGDDIGVAFRDPVKPTAALREEVVDQVSKSMKAPAPILPVGASYPIDFEVPNLFAKLDEIDLRPYIELVDTEVARLAKRYRDAREAHLAGFLDEVGEVAEGFDSSTAREILRKRDGVDK